MHSNTRALRRASDAASGRRPLAILTAVAGAALALTLTGGIASTAAAAAATEPLGRYSDRAALTIAEGTDALETAEALGADVAEADLDLGETPTTVDTAEVKANLDALEERMRMPDIVVAALAVDTEAEIAAVQDETAALKKAFTVAKEKNAAAEAKRAAEEKAAKERAAAAAAALAEGNTVAGAKATAQRLASSQYGWGSGEFSCLVSLWNKESGWNYQAFNPSGATGIPQALPGSKMASAGSDWATNATTQIVWGLGYISSVYGSPCAAWSHSQAVNWY